MTTRTIPDGEFIKVDLQKGKRARFAAACARVDMSMSAVIRLVVDSWIKDIEAASDEDLGVRLEKTLAAG